MIFSEFGDIFDVNHFINSLRNEIKIVKKIPLKFRQNSVSDDIMSIPPVSWSNESYYMNQVRDACNNYLVVCWQLVNMDLCFLGRYFL